MMSIFFEKNAFNVGLFTDDINNFAKHYKNEKCYILPHLLISEHVLKYLATFQTT